MTMNDYKGVILCLSYLLVLEVNDFPVISEIQLSIVSLRHYSTFIAKADEKESTL